VIVCLEVPDVFARNAVFDEVFVSFNGELWTLIACYYPLKIEDRRHFLLLAVVLNNSLLLLK